MEATLTKHEVLNLFKNSNESGKSILIEKYGKDYFSSVVVDLENINTIDDIIKFSNPSKEVLAIVSYQGKESALIGAANNLLREMLADIYNEGVPVDSSKGEKGWFPVFNCANGGFAFSDSDYDDWDTDTHVGSRFAFRKKEHSDLAAQKFPEIYRKALMK